MSLQQLYAWSKKIHKWLLWIVTVVGGWMMLSGFLMHKELEGESILPLDLMVFMRFWHNKASQVFIVIFGLQALTGILMWGVPKILMGRKPVNP